MFEKEQQLVLEYNWVAYTMSASIGIHDLPFIDREDIYQTALLFMCEAAMQYREDKGCKFSSFAYPIVRYKLINEIKRLKRKNADTLRVAERDDPDCPTPYENSLNQLVQPDVYEDYIKQDYIFNTIEKARMAKINSIIYQTGLAIIDGRIREQTRPEIVEQLGITTVQYNIYLMRTRSMLKAFFNSAA